MNFAHKFSLIFASLGLLISSYGVLLSSSDMQKKLFFVGAVFLISSSIVERHRLYIWLQAVVIVGTLSAFLPIQNRMKFLFPVSAGVLYLVVNRKFLLKRNSELLGAVGVILLSTGFAISHPAVYLSGALVISAYSFGEFRRGVKIALLWLILNLIFAASSIYALFN